ncbi:hypothetical protein INT47_005432 [Mucor saturninus]|uniref:Uncharacterized protein n=1 Tax=Mucor saturninus TaxID=64648 RepID=A0A8H7QUR1_9FUNG|nr:hypothetical protein INT47_005432 [Mucor saturninus]
METLVGAGGRPTLMNDPESSTSKERLRYTHKNPIKKDKTMLYMLGDHVIDMFDQSLKQCNATELRFKRLDQTTKTALFMQKQKYENTMNTLNEKIKILEKKNSHIMDPKGIPQHHQDDEKDDNDDEPITRLEKYEREIGILHMQLSACEQSTHKAVSHYATELEKERLESRKLTSIIQKQQNTISLLESQLTETQFILRTSSSSQKPEGHGSHDLIKALVDLQSMELDDKKHLLANLVNEREILLQKIDELNNPSSISVHKQRKLNRHQDRSSIDLLAQIASANLVQDEPKSNSMSSSSSSGTVLYFSTTPPPTPPPSCALPLPPSEHAPNLCTSIMLPLKKNQSDIFTNMIQPLSSTNYQPDASSSFSRPPSPPECQSGESNSLVPTLETQPKESKRAREPSLSDEQNQPEVPTQFMRLLSPPLQDNSDIKTLREDEQKESDSEDNSAPVSPKLSPRTAYLMNKKKVNTD